MIEPLSTFRESSLLSEADQQRIRAEEIFREEVRRDLELKRTPSTGPKRLWAFLNMPTCIWFLSTCVVGLVTLGFTKFHERAKAISRNRELVHKLDTEITGRLCESLLMLEGYDHSLTMGASWFSRRGLFSAVMQELNGRSYMYEELAKRSFPSLLAELKGLLPDRDREHIQVAVDAFNYLRQEEKSAVGNLQGKSGGPGVVKLSPEELEAARKDLQDANDTLRNKLRLKRWQS